ncbi:rod shape-determining protein MreD [Candidatus Cyanaurora vandensis]|uniref:rod shape-determining protein MreD n=1 Tax=Candidatus Cyanaurora vandensis TaxID=2714958 RepID=UPI002580F9BE|nr:rod shape-determining protein MreD [Candidatus Cyanaurora vandensis]
MLSRPNLMVHLGTVLSGLACAYAQWLYLPGLSLGGVTVDWVVLWVVCFSFERTWWQGLLAGCMLGLVLDGLGPALPTHTLGLALVGVLTAWLRNYRLLQSEVLALGLIAFALAVLYETTLALQFMALGWVETDLLWAHHQRVSLASGLVTSLWAPLLWWPLRHWWKLTG